VKHPGRVARKTETGVVEVGYIEGYAVVEGALDEEREFRTWREYQEWAEQVLTECQEKRLQVEIYCIYHDHELGIECECAQFLTDHHPDYAWAPPSKEGIHGN